MEQKSVEELVMTFAVGEVIHAETRRHAATALLLSAFMCGFYGANSGVVAVATVADLATKLSALKGGQTYYITLHHWLPWGM